MRQGSDGRAEVFPWGNAPAAPEPARFAVGDAVYSGAWRGDVVSVDADEATMGIVWMDGDGPIIYPLDATYLRKALPWETE
jgi:hypothetical protein